MLTPEELATIEAFMNETKNIDEYKRALVNGHLFIPGYGHINSSRAASFLVRTRPRFLLARGHGFSRHYCDLSQW